MIIHRHLRSSINQGVNISPQPKSDYHISGSAYKSVKIIIIVMIMIIRNYCAWRDRSEFYATDPSLQWHSTGHIPVTLYFATGLVCKLLWTDSRNTGSVLVRWYGLTVYSVWGVVVTLIRVLLWPAGAFIHTAHLWDRFTCNCTSWQSTSAALPLVDSLFV